MCPEALLKVGGEAYITLGGDRKALEKIDILHPFALEARLQLAGRQRVTTRSSPKRAKIGGGGGN